MGPGSCDEATAARAPQWGGLSLSGGSPTGYRRAARETPEPGDRDAGEQRTVATDLTVRGHHLLTKEQPLTACTANNSVRGTGCLPLVSGEAGHAGRPSDRGPAGSAIRSGRPRR